jgi:hypothetical protein
MTAVPRREVLGAATALASVALLGLVIGLENGPAPPIEESGRASAAGLGQWVPGMASAVEAKALAPDVLPASSAPTKLAAASSAPSSDEADAAEENVDNSSDAPSPPQLYAPPGPAPSAPTSAPSNDDSNLPPF